LTASAVKNTSGILYFGDVMKKSMILIFLFISLISAPVSSSDRVDMIVLLDNSISVLPFYDEIQTSLLGRIVSEHLAPGDSFNLITFADTPEVEVAREIRNRNDIENILSYSSLLQPMGNHTDLIMALRFLYKYSLDLPLNNRKKIVILTDGIHDPPESSPYYHYSDEEAVGAVEKAAEDIHKQGWDVSIVEIEEDNNLPVLKNNSVTDESSRIASSQTDDSKINITQQSSKNGVDVIDTVSDSIGTTPKVFNPNEEDMAGIALGMPLVSVPGHLGHVSGSLTVPLTIKNRSNEPLMFSLSKVYSSGKDLLKKKVSVEIKPEGNGELQFELILPDGLVEGEQHLLIELYLVDGERISPEFLELNFLFEVKRGLAGGAAMLLDWKIITVVIALILAIVIILILKKSPRITRQAESPTPSVIASGTEDSEAELKIDRESNAASTKTVKQNELHMESQHPEDLAVMSLTNPDISDDTRIFKKNRPIHMFVFGQNTKSGVSNVQWLGLNRRRSIGNSAGSFFRIFFVKVPTILAEIECREDDFIFYPKAEDYFPDLQGPIHSCLNRRIKVVTPEEKIFFIEFRQWVSKLEKLNRLLTMTRTPGQPDMDF
jgi:hypothetical protein